MKGWLAKQQAVRCLLGTALLCGACGAVRFHSGDDVAKARPLDRAGNRGADVDRAPSSSVAVSASTETTTVPARLAKAPRPIDDASSSENDPERGDARNAGEARPVLRLGASCALHSLNIQVTDQGGIVLLYTAERGFVERLRREVHALVRKHNARTTLLARQSLHGFLEIALTVLAIPSDVPAGIHVTLVPPTPDAVPDLFANTELYAPDLLPDPEWQEDRRHRCGA